MVSTEIIGFIGTLIIIVAYFPQVRHIVKEHCAGGVSVRAWMLWLVATVLVLIHAINTGDNVFMFLQWVNLIAITVIIVMIKLYKGKTCHQIELKMNKMRFK